MTLSAFLLTLALASQPGHARAGDGASKPRKGHVMDKEHEEVMPGNLTSGAYRSPMENLIKRFEVLASWREMDAEDRFQSLRSADLLDDMDLGDWSYEAACEFIDELDDDDAALMDYFVTDEDDHTCPYYMVSDLEEIYKDTVRDVICEKYPVLENDQEAFEDWLGDWVRTVNQRSDLDAIAQASRPTDEDLATPEQAMARRSRGRAL